ncbi:hypothetical protein D623_10027275 [Myotis brandtii]|uniref:Uncharacterized protein n=1 Tax=Myotis brandtii TaxID=109478 RepID=S7NKI4_MYOBR|nr:hypothetical protein D623_10027275 [Myotis brandtii]
MKVEDGVCLQRQLSGVQEQRCTVHKMGVGEAEGIGEASEGQGQTESADTGTTALSSRLSSEPGQAWEFSECPFLQELNGVHRGEAGAIALYVQLQSLQSCTPASLAWVEL